MRTSGRRHLVASALLILFLLASGLTWLAAADTRPDLPAASAGDVGGSAPITVASDVSVVALSSSTGQWVLTTFCHVEQGAEFWCNRRLYRATGAGKAQFVLDVDAQALFEADRGYDRASRQPKSYDVVLVLDKDLRPVRHALRSTSQPGTSIRFQGKVFTVQADRSLSDAGRVIPESATTLQPIEITKSALQHVADRHTANGSKNAGKSIFSPREDVASLVRDAQLLTPVPQAGGNCQRIFDAGRAIGTDRATGRQTSTYTVITTQSGKLVTAFPGLP